MAGFTHHSLPGEVVFGSGVLAEVRRLADGLGCRRMLVVSTRSQDRVAAKVKDLLGPAGAAAFPGAAMHTPVDVTLKAMQLVEGEGIDGLVAVGGGSAIGLGKAIALRTDLPQICIPTTYAGSEMTPVVGQTEDGRKTTQRSMKVLPEAVVYDVDLTLSLPIGVSVTSGFNAIAHAVEALYAREGNPLLSAAAEECARLMGHALPRIVVDPSDAAARAAALQGAWLGGWSLANGGSALHHRLCHVLGGMFALPHAETHTVLLPHVLAYNAAAAPEALERLRRALGFDHAARGLYDLARSLGAPRALKDFGLPQSGISEAVDALMADPPWNPAPLDSEAIGALLTHAWRGDRPRQAD